MSGKSQTVAAGALPAWQLSELPSAPPGGARNWMRLLGPGVLLAGASVGTGEWLFGPAVSAQYGGTLLWLATISIGLQVFCNLEVMRYALYCGEPILVGALRTKPGPIFWMVFIAVLDIAAIWPYNASNAAVPLAAAWLGHLPGDATGTVLGITMTELQFVKGVGFVIFFVAFVPLIFGGTIYRMLERLMAFKLVVVLGYLFLVTIFMVSGRNVKEVLRGFVRFGTVPLRSETVIAGRHFNITKTEGSGDEAVTFTVKGTVEKEKPLVTEMRVLAVGKSLTYGIRDTAPPEYAGPRDRIAASAIDWAHRNAFLVERTVDGRMLRIQGTIGADHVWQPEQFQIVESDGAAQSFKNASEAPAPYAERFEELVSNQGLEMANLVGYYRKNGRLPDLDWVILASFAAIAGAGGLTNAMFSNYTRDKGWGMGAQVGAIPSALGGREITLSHVGKVFAVNVESRKRWRGWMRHIVKDQVVVWMFCSFVGMALPCMLSLEFIRHAPVQGDRVAAMTAEGISNRYPDYQQFFWPLTLLVGFLILAPGQIMSGDQIARRWTDIFWSYSSRARRLGEHKVKFVYYGILAMYALWGTVALSLFDPLQTAKIGTVLQNVALGSSALLALYVNHVLMPRELRPRWFNWLGTFFCGVFFLGISLGLAVIFLK